MSLRPRERRRDRTIRVGERRRRHHLGTVHQGLPGRPAPALHCVCERSVWRFAKRPSLECNCRSRRHGQPKLARGICRSWKPRNQLLGRSAWRREAHLWRATMCDPTDAFDLGR